MLRAAYPLLMTRRAIASMRRGRGLLLALVLGLSQGTAWLHAAAISHATCLEHGESIHAVVGAHGPDDVTRPDAPADARDRHRAAPDAGDTAAHDHCASSALLRWREVALAPPPAAPIPPAFQTSTFHQPSRAASARVVVYLVAPKTSPPHADA